jgi:hypothetical protein
VLRGVRGRSLLDRHFRHGRCDIFSMPLTMYVLIANNAPGFPAPGGSILCHFLDTLYFFSFKVSVNYNPLTDGIIIDNVISNVNM